MSSSKKRTEGYLLIDNRNSPGVSSDLIRASGKEVPIVASGQIYESATMTCAHCNTIVVLNPQRTRPRGYCFKCDKYICDNPICGKECHPFDKLLDVAQEQAFRNNIILIGEGERNGKVVI